MWAPLMALGFHQLGLRPEEFWTLTPAELSAIAGAKTGGSALGRSGLEALMQKFPDEKAT